MTERTLQHQVGGDDYAPGQSYGQPPDAYVQASDPPHVLGGANAASSQTTGALALGLRFDRRGRAAARVLITSGFTDGQALAALGVARRRRFRVDLRAVAHDWHGWLARTWLPATSDHRVIDVAKRTLITVRLAIDPDSGAIVASSDTQGPYGEDWTRDGSFIDQLLDLNGYTSVVTRHNLFYAAIQTSPLNPSPLRASGNWAMTSYGDGIDGGPIPYEIDETGLAIWAMSTHASVLSGAARKAYLEGVYPAISRAADYLVVCVDPTTGLQCEASEDDNPTPSESLHGAETVELGLRSAIAAAEMSGRGGTAEATAWRARLARLDAAIQALYDPASHSYREGNSSANAYNLIYGDGGWLLWPVQLHPYSDPRMTGEANAVRAALDASLRAPEGEYEMKALLGLAYAWGTPTPAESHELRSVLSYIARSLTTPTYLFGEAWERFQGKPRPVEDMPHVWEHALFWLSAVKIDGRRRYRFATGDLVERQCRAGGAPRAVCAS